jgi:hypothetical protein
VFAAVAGHRIVPRATDASVSHDAFAGLAIAKRILAQTAVVNV